MLFTARFIAPAALALSACIPSVVVGDNPQDEPGPDATTTTTAPTTDGAPTTGATGVPATCGDGLVGPGELCDDGNDEPNDGCDAACQRSGRVVWSVEPADLDAVAVRMWVRRFALD